VRSHRPELRKLSASEAFKNLGQVLGKRRTWRLLLRKLSQERLLVRASALAYDSLLAIVPFMAFSMGLVATVGGRDSLARLLRELALFYVPRSAGEAVERLIGLAETLDFHAIGAFGALALLPVVFALVDSVEHALADVFGMPRRNHWWRLLVLGVLSSLAPFGSVFGVRYLSLSSLPLHQWLAPFGLLTALLYVVFRRLPRSRVSRRAALLGGVSAALILSTAKLAFGIYAKLAVSLHVLWGAVAFVPLFLVWILLSWYAVLFAAAVAAVLHHELVLVEYAHQAGKARPGRQRRRLQKRLIRRAGIVPPAES